MQRIELTDAEQEIARMVSERCNEIVRDGQTRASTVLAAAHSEANAYAARAQRHIVNLLLRRGVQVGHDDQVTPELDPKTKVAVAVTITPRDPS